ncbi:MAG: efflux RND transporter permease subunit, partial [Pseudomonadota bacterium]
MNPIRLAIERPIAVVAGVLMIVMFGWIGLLSIPIQLAPDVNRPIINVETAWPGAAPAEIEREIINRQEEELKGLDGLASMNSTSQPSEGSIELEFDISANMDRSLLLVANRLDRVQGYPDEADQPILSTAGAEDNAIAWFSIVRTDGNDREIHTYGDFVEDVVQEALERVPGVARTNAFGGAEREMQVIVDPERMAQYGLTVGDVRDALRGANISLSAGDVEEGKRRYVVRTEGEFSTVEQVRATVIRSDRGSDSGRLSRLTVADIANVQMAYKEPSARIRYLGQPALAVNVLRETGANVIETMEGIRAVVEDLNRSAMPGAGLEFRQVYDETIYINSAIDLVQNNILFGGSLAAIVLLVFLRSIRATLVVSIAIPVSVIGSFVAMAALGRSINVISLAGMAFAVGMVVDAAIVVLENIFRLRQQGKPAREAAYQGASRVWGAVLVSALTTVMAFIPILVMELEVGQLFRDIAVAISVSVMLSLLVAVTVIPALSSRLLGGSGAITRIRIPIIDHIADAFVWVIMSFTRMVVRLPVVGLLVAVSVVGGAMYGAWTYLPKLEYLPEGNRNFVFGVILPPPGYNLDTNSEVAGTVEGAVRQYWASETGPESAPGEPPKIQNFFYVTTPSTTFVGASAVDDQRAGELIPVISGPIFSEPGT